MFNIRFATCIIALYSFLPMIPVSAGNSFFGVGDLPGGEFYSSATAVSDDGAIVVGTSFDAEPDDILNTQDASKAFRWDLASQQLMAVDSAANGDVPYSSTGISGDGTTIVGRVTSDTTAGEAFATSDSMGTITLGQQGSTGIGSIANDVSQDGTTIIGDFLSNDPIVEAFRWTASTGMIGLGDLPGGSTQSNAFAISSDGTTIVGRAGSDAGIEAYRWTNMDGMTGLGALSAGSANSVATDVSHNGLVVVGTSNSEQYNQEAFRWTEEHGMQGLGVLPVTGRGSESLATNGTGDIIVGVSGAVGLTQVAFVWDQANGMRELQEVLVNQFNLEAELAGWDLLWATDISPDGKSIVGRGINPNGNTEGWLVRLDSPINVPEPTSLALALFWVCALCLRFTAR